MSDEWKPAGSVDLVAEECRNAIFWSAFQAKMMDEEGRKQDAEELRQRACFMAEFGVRAGMLPPAEGNDWLDAVWGRKPLAEVTLKYTGKEQPDA